MKYITNDANYNPIGNNDNDGHSNIYNNNIMNAL